MRSIVKPHATALSVMPEVLNRASSAFLDSPVKHRNDKNVVLLMNFLVSLSFWPVQSTTRRESFRTKEGFPTSGNDNPTINPYFQNLFLIFQFEYFSRLCYYFFLPFIICPFQGIVYRKPGYQVYFKIML
jgi:hypothetical protein